MKQSCGGGPGRRVDGGAEVGGADGELEGLDDELLGFFFDVLDASRLASGTGLVGITPVAYALAQVSTLTTYSIERL